MYQQEKHGVRKKSTAIKLVCRKINLRLHAFQRRATTKHEILKTCNGGGFLPLCVITNVVTPRRDMLGLK
jgi:hypothetical protein